YDRLHMRDPRKRRLIAPIAADEMADLPARIHCANFTPYVCRLFRATCDLKDIAEHFGVIALYASDGAKQAPELSSGTSIDELIKLCEAEDFAHAYSNLLACLDAPTSKLRGLFENLVEVYGKHRTLFSLVILLDQFEELFTRFVDVGSLSREQH